ncbi:MAG: UDP-N-acetylmuramoyl-tripeptide--D-alanyl-D-alanine ligase [Desulfobacterales bacterium]
MRATTDWEVSDVLKATGGRLVQGPQNRRFSGIGIDSRRISPGEIFVSIKGEVHDGHRFIPDVVASGIRGVVIGRKREPEYRNTLIDRPDVVVIAVEETTRALGELAAYHRRRIDVPVVALTGSNGKTTTRAMTEQVLAVRFSVLATSGNLNNAIGLPLTLLRLTGDHEAAVVEMGMNHPGEIDYLGQIAEPDIGMITNISPAHLEGLGSIDGVRDAKGELLGRIRKEGTALLNADDPKVLELVPRSPVTTLLFGESPAAEIRATEIEEAPGGVRFRLVTPRGDHKVSLTANGRFMVSNALAAAAAGFRMGLEPAEIARGLEKFRPVKGRMEIRASGGVHIIDDTYNANPASMAAALRTLDHLKGEARGIAVLGDMLELGPASAALHRELGERVARSETARLFVTGNLAEAVADGAIAAGMAPERIRLGEVAELSEALRRILKEGDWVLVKGSRGMRMERIVQNLQKPESE